ncbi:ATPase AAA-type core [Trinorchestia longiramus]|nr:ATPase AAA-type core [Trinorchestia longiramus]
MYNSDNMEGAIPHEGAVSNRFSQDPSFFIDVFDGKLHPWQSALAPCCSKLRCLLASTLTRMRRLALVCVQILVGECSSIISSNTSPCAKCTHFGCHFVVGLGELVPASVPAEIGTTGPAPFRPSVFRVVACCASMAGLPSEKAAAGARVISHSTTPARVISHSTTRHLPLHHSSTRHLPLHHSTRSLLLVLRHLHALRNFIGNLVEQAEKSGGCECHKPPSLLLVGPPGAGKTYLVKQMSKVCEMPLFGVHTHQVTSAASIKKLFSQARNNYPSLVFLDDVDSIFADHDKERTCTPQVQQIREEIFSELGPRKLKIHDPESAHNPTQQLVQNSPGGSSSSRGSSRSSSLSRPRPSAPELNDSYDESLYPDNNGIIVVAATSTPWLLYKDHELLSRFRGVYLVGLPDKGSRYTLLQNLLKEVHHSLSDEDIMEIAEKTQGFTPADLMVVMKTLSYRQFSFLLSMVNGREADGGGQSMSGSDGNSGSTTPSSELTETGSDTDIDGLNAYRDQQKRSGSVAGVLAAAAAGSAVAAAAASCAPNKSKDSNPEASPKATAVPPSSQSDAPVSSSGGEGLLSRVAAAGVTTAAGVAAVTALQGDWATDSEEEEEEESGLVTQRERAPCEKTSASPDSGLVQSSEETLPSQTDEPSLVPHPHSTSNSLPSAKSVCEAGDPPDDGCREITQVPAGSTYANEREGDEEIGNSSNDDGSRDTSLLDTSRESADHTAVYVLENNAYDDANSTLDSITSEGNVADTIDATVGPLSESQFQGVGNSSRSPNVSPSHLASSGSVSPTSPSLHTDRSTYDNVLPDGGMYDPEPYARDTANTDKTHDSQGVDATGCSETEEVLVHPEHKDAPFPTGEEVSRPDAESCGDSPIANNTACDMAEGSVELHYSEPPEPLRDDNMAVDSDSDNESPMLRPRRVGFADRPVAIGSMSDNGSNGGTGGNNNNNTGGGYSGRSSGPSPLDMDCGGGDLPPNITLDMNGTGGGGADNILRQLLSRPPMSANNGGVSPMQRASPSPGCSPTPPASPVPSHCSSGAATLASSGSGRASPAPVMHQVSITLLAATSLMSPVNGLQSAPLHNTNGGEVFDPSSAMGGQPEHGDAKLGRRNSQRGAGVKVISGLGASAAATSAAVDTSPRTADPARTVSSVNDDDLAKLVDALEMHMDGGRSAGVASSTGESSDPGSTDEESCTDEEDDEGDGDGKAAMRALDEIGAGTMNIVPITLADVLDVIKKGYRTVTDEEMKKYTDFMVWFANVAKSACPHNNGNRSEAPSADEDDFGVESTLCATPNLLKRNQRRRPLRKLGKFLLKALMFILD